MKINPALLIVLSLTITIVVVLAQNLGTVIQISFLGFKSPPLPLSLGMLFAFLSGGIAAALWNQLSVWLAGRSEQQEEEVAPTPKTNEQLEDDYDDDEEYDDEDDDILEIEYIDR